MSRSTKLSQIEAGVYLVIISEVTLNGPAIMVRFTTHDGRNHDKEYDFKKEPFLKLCYALNSIKGDTVFDSQDVIGDRLWIAVKEIWDAATKTKTLDIFDTLPYSEFTPQISGNPLTGEIGAPFIELVNAPKLSESEKKALIKTFKGELVKDEFDEI